MSPLNYNIIHIGFYSIILYIQINRGMRKRSGKRNNYKYIIMYIAIGLGLDNAIIHIVYV